MEGRGVVVTGSSKWSRIPDRTPRGRPHRSVTCMNLVDNIGADIFFDLHNGGIVRPQRDSQQIGMVKIILKANG